MKNSRAVKTVVTAVMALAFLNTTACSKSKDEKPAVVASNTSGALPQESVPIPGHPASETTYGAANADTVQPSEQNPGDLVQRMNEHRFEDRDAFTALVKQLDAQTDASITKMKVGYSEIQAPPAQREAMLELDRAAAAYKERIVAIDSVRAETWETVKSAIVSFWMNLQTAMAKAQAEQV